MSRSQAFAQTLVVDEAFRRDFPAERFAAYEDFAGAPGTAIKREAASRVTLIEGAAGDEADGAPRRFVLKEYRHGPLRSLAGAFETPKAEREFRSLAACRDRGVPAVEPVAFGVLRGRLGRVRASFVVTAFVEGAQDLRRHLRARLAERGGLKDADFELLGVLGRLVRRLHEGRFFLMTGKPKNVLVLPEGARAGGEPLAFLDIPRAVEVRGSGRLRRAQRRDLAMLLADLASDCGPEVVDAFYAGYLPDPLGDAGGAFVPERILAAIRAQNNETPWAGFLHRLKKRTRRAWRARRAREAAITEGPPHG